ncbi:MAG TPA: glycosyl hydrolase family 28-related protein [Verrucomicrobiae bacterium]|jgi:polygalacturonase|nr:glycosyl hydrolase family 28-related protein [Verrucomicrobiae bacterium]
MFASLFVPMRTAVSAALLAAFAGFTIGLVPKAQAAGNATQLIWTTQPGLATNGFVFAQSPVLQTADASGNPTTAGLPATKLIQIGLYSGRGVLGGTLIANIGTSGGNGSVTLTNLQLSLPGSAQLIAYDIGNGFLPTNISAGATCRLWLDAADANAMTVSGTQVVTWLDKSGKTNNASGGTPPTVGTNSTLAQTQAGLAKVVHFNGANDYLSVDLSSLSNSAYTVIAMEVAANKGSSSSYILGNDNGGQDATLHIGYNTSNEWRWGEYGDDLNFDTTFKFPVPRISTERITTAFAESLYFDGTNVANRTAGALLGGTFLKSGTVGRAINSGNYQGDLAELIVYNSALSVSDRTNIESYLATKWTTGLHSATTTTFQVLQTNGMVFVTGLHEVIPTLNTNEIVITVTTPQEYGAKGDGVTDDTAAFQNAINAVYNANGSGGGVIFVPNGFYAFSNSLTIPNGVTLHGDWNDWTKGTNGLVGTTFKVYTGAGQSNGTPFITMSGSSSLKDVNIWYPDQNASSIVSYPYSIQLSGDCVIKNVVLVNSYQGIQAANGDRHILSTVIGSPLFLGVNTDSIFDICHAEDVRFSPDVWPASLLTNAPAPGGPHAAWMRTNGTGWRMIRVDGDLCVDTFLSGYNTGILFTNTGNGDPGITFYSGAISNCATAIMVQDMPSGLGLMFANFTLDGDVAVARTRTDTDANIQFDHCTIIGRSGTAVKSTGADSGSWMQFQNCTISNTLALSGPGVFNVVNSTLQGATQCTMSSTATRAAFVGCTFTPTRNIVNSGSANNLLVDARPAISNAFPVFYWTNVLNDYESRQPAKTNLFVATAYGATGNGVTDDTAAINAALAAAGANGGGIVYVPAGLYRLTATLDVPSGVELRGAYELRHWPGAAPDGFAKGTVLRPYEGAGTTNGPVAVALEANSGLVGVTISYETQNTNCVLFPPAIQGRGGNIYCIGIACPNPYYYLDMDTYTCTNHFLYLVDGWAIKTGFNIGNGSTGSMVDNMANWTYWIGNGQSQSTLPQNIQAPVLEFVLHQSCFYTLGDCTELLVKDFSIIQNTYMRLHTENGVGPQATLIGAYCDATIQGMIFDGAGTSDVNAVNLSLCVFNVNNDADLASTTVGILSTNGFSGTAHFFNTTSFAERYYDINLYGGDFEFEVAHIENSFNGANVNGGVMALDNLSAGGVTGNVPYGLTFGTNAGMAGKTSEVIGDFSPNGFALNNINVADPINGWIDYALSSSTVLNIGSVVIGDIYPDGAHQFEPAGAFSFMAFSTNGINNNGITVQVVATNLAGQVYANTFSSANGLIVNGNSTTKSVSAPLITNALYKMTVRVSDTLGNSATNTLSFDTVSPAYTFEAEDFDYNGGSFIDNPMPDAYLNLAGVVGIDYTNGITGQGGASYRPQGIETEGASDKLRLAFSGITDYDVGFANAGNWANYTRTIAAGNYNFYMRAASPGAAITDAASVGTLTSGRGTSNQVILKLGTIGVQDTGSYQTYTWIPLKDTSGNLVKIAGTGEETFRVTTDRSGFNVNYYMLVTTNTQGSFVFVPAAPGGVIASAGNGQAVVNWQPSPSAANYNVKQSLANGGPYTLIASNLSALSFTNTGLSNGITYYYEVTATNTFGESAAAGPASARPVSLSPPQLGTVVGNGTIQFSWGTDHTGWRLQMQTNSLGSGFSSTWVDVPGATNANQITIPVNSSSGTAFFRLVYP